MAFNPQEQKIIDYGLQAGKSKDEVKSALQNFRLGVTPSSQKQTAIQSSETQQSQPGLFSGLGNIKDAAVSGVKQFGEGYGQTAEGVKEGNFGKIGRGILNEAAGGISTVFSPVTGIIKSGAQVPGIKETVEATNKNIVQPLSDNPFSNSPKVQKFLQENPDAPEIVQNLLTVFGTLALGTLPKVSGITGINSVDQGLVNLTKRTTKVEGFHGTTPENAASIKTSGFDVTKSRGGAQEPVAINLTTDQADALHYAGGKSEGVLPVTMKGKNIKTFSSQADYIKAVEDKFGDYTGPNATKFLKDYDGVVIDGASPTGGKMLLTTKPETLKVNSLDAKNSGGGIGKNVARDIVPTADRIVNHQVSRALDLTQGDVKNINLSTGNEVGKWIADKNLIGESKAATLKKIDDYFESNYNTVRAEIRKVKQSYIAKDIPRYREALTQLKNQIGDTPGLQSQIAEVESLINKEYVKLEDVQRAKELLDDHFQLYKVTGDVKAGVTKSGLANIRSGLKNFIEKEVEKNTGADIRELNNNVSTARSISDAIETRSTRGLTRSNIKIGDLGLFIAGSGVGTPLFGAALVVAKKILESPTFRLRVAQVLDTFSDATKAKIITQLEKGIVPKQIEPLLLEAPAEKGNATNPHIMPEYKGGESKMIKPKGPGGLYEYNENIKASQKAAGVYKDSSNSSKSEK